MIATDPPPRHPLADRRFLALLAVSFLVSFCSAPRYALLPIYVEAQLLRSPLFSAGLRSIFLILGGAFALLAGRLADRFGVKRIYVIGTMGPLVTGLVFLTGDPLLLASLCVGIGTAQGFASAGGQSYLIGAVDARHIGTASAGYFLGSTLGNAAGNLLAGPLADRLGYGLLGTVTVVCGAVLVVVTLVILPTTPVTVSTAAGQGPAAVGAGSRRWLRREVVLLLGIRYLPTCYWGAITLLVPILIYRLSGTNAAVTTFSAVSLAIAAVFQILTGRLCDRFGCWTPMLVAAGVETASAVGLAIFSGSLTGVYVFGIVAAASAWSLSTTIPGLVQQTARDGERGRLVGITHFAWSAGMLTGNLGGGMLLEVTPTLPFGVGSLFCLGALACGVLLYRDNRKVPSSQRSEPGS